MKIVKMKISDDVFLSAWLEITGISGLVRLEGEFFPAAGIFLERLEYDATGKALSSEDMQKHLEAIFDKVTEAALEMHKELMS